MSVLNAIISGLARNGDSAATAFLRNADNVDNLVAAMRQGNVDDFLRQADGGAALANDPVIMRTMAKLGDNIQYLDELETTLRGQAVNTEELLARLGVDASDDIAAGLTRSISYYNETIRVGAEQASSVDDLLAQADGALSRTAHPAATAADDVAAAADSGMSFADRLVLRHGKVTMFASATAATALVAEFASGGAISGAGAHGALAVADALQESAPALADAIRENGLAVLAFGADLYDTPRDAAVNAGAIVLEEQGQPDAAAALRIANTVTSPTFYISLMAIDDKDQRMEAFLDKVTQDTGVDRARIERHFLNHPLQRAAVEESLGGVDLSVALPGLAGQPDPRAQVRQAAETVRRQAGDITALQSLSGSALATEFNQVVQNNNLNLLSGLNMFLATVLDFLGLDSIADHFKRAVVVDATISQYGDRFNLTSDPALTASAAPAPSGPRPDDPAPA